MSEIIEAPRSLMTRIAGEILSPEVTALAAGPLGEALQHAMRLAAASLSERTERAYSDAWAHFSGWCEERGVRHLPADPAIVGAYLAARSKMVGQSSLRISLAALAHYHRRMGHPWSASHPIIASVLKGILRTQKKPVRPAAALTSTEIRQILSEMDDDLAGLRDKALFLVGFAGGFRRTELLALDVEDVRYTREGMTIRIRFSKRDQEGKGADVGISKGTRPGTCPVRALQEWLRSARIEYGAVFCSIGASGRVGDRLGASGFYKILKARAAAAEVVAPEGERMSPHGLRAGMITEAYLNGALDEQVMAHARQRSRETTRAYRMRAKVVQDSPTKLLDL